MPDHRHWKCAAADPAFDAVQIFIAQAWVAVNGVVHAQLHVFVHAQLMIRQKIDALEISQLAERHEKIDHGADLRFAVVDAF